MAAAGETLVNGITPASAAVPGRPFLTLVRFNRPYARRYLIGGMLALFFTAMGLVEPLVVRALVARFEQNTMTGLLLLGFVLLMITLSAFAGVARYFQRILMIGASREFEYDLRNTLFAHIQRLSPRYFQGIKTGDLMARATNDLNYVREFIGPGLMGTVDMIRIPFTLAIMIWLSASLTATALIPLPFITVLVFIFMRFMNRQSKRAQELFADVTSRAQENLAGARVVKAYGIAQQEAAHFRRESAAYMRANIKLVAIMSTGLPIIGILIGVILLLVLWRGGAMVIDGRLSLANFSAFLVCMVGLAWPLAQLGWVLTLYQRGAVGMNRISSILAEIPAIRDTEKTQPEAAVTQGSVEFRRVSFAYDEHPVLQDVSVHVPAGTTLAIVGPTGSGKTTFVQLLTRAFDPGEGEILVDSQPTPELPLEALRGSIGYVPQDTFIFSDSIRNNLLAGNPKASDEMLWRACEVAQLADAIREIPAGLDTLLGERGINLSGGQKQRLTIARAIVRDPVILILDDALSSVDTHTEEQILQHLRAVMQGRTAFIISHRISSIRHADQIIVMEEGRIVEQGDHEALVAHGGLYARMYQRQLLETALEDLE